MRLIPTLKMFLAREPISDEVEVLFIGGGFSALLTSARLRERGIESVRIVERGSDVGGTWYWNRYPGAACDVVSYDYLPLLDELDYVPVNHYSRGPKFLVTVRQSPISTICTILAVFNTPRLPRRAGISQTSFGT
jgi:cyclohexanone monooxygenase